MDKTKKLDKTKTVAEAAKTEPQADRKPPTLNEKEARVLTVLRRAKGKGVALSDLAGSCFPKKGRAPKTKGNSWARNSLRKLVREGMVAKAERGTYKIL